MTKNNSDEQKELQRKKHEDSVKYLYFSRYLMIRYIVTIFLFTNLFWLIIDFSYRAIPGIILSLVMTIYSAIASIEQLAKMHNRKRDVPVTRIYLWVQLVFNCCLLVITFLPIAKNVFPFATNQNSKLLISLILLVGIILCLLCEHRIFQIRNDRDRYRKVIDTFQKNRQ